MMRQEYQAHPSLTGMGLFDGIQCTTEFNTKYITTCHARQAAESLSAHWREINFKNEGIRLPMNASVQQRYIEARKRYEDIQEQCLAAARPFDPHDIEGFAQRLITAERQLGYLQAFQDMKEAEQALVAWAQSLAACRREAEARLPNMV
jgi:hypothetical protein